MSSESSVAPRFSGIAVAAVWGGLLIVALVLRIYRLGEVSVWYDEASVWKTISFSWPEMWSSLKRNVHPPAYYVLVRGWKAGFGDSVEALRSFSVIWGMLTLLLVEGLARGVSSDRRSFSPSLATWLYAISPIAIEHSQQIRMYSLAICLAAGLGLGLLRVLKSPASWSGWLLLGGCGNLLPLAHYYGLWHSGLAALIVVGMMVFNPRQRLLNCWRQVLLAAAFSVVVWGWWLPVFLEQHRRVQADYWIQAYSNREVLIYLAEWISTSRIRDQGIDVCAWVAGCVILAMFLSLFSRNSSRILVSSLAICPVVLSILYSLATRNLLQGRYWGMAHLFFIVALAALFESVSHPRLRRFLLVPFVGWSIFWCGHGLKDRYELSQRAGLRQIGTVLRNERLPGEPVFVVSSFYTPSIQYYVRDFDAVFVIQPITPLKHDQGQAIIRPEEVRLLSEQALVGADRFWFVADDLMTGTVANPDAIAIPHGWKRVSTRKFDEGNRLPTPLDLREYRRVETSNTGSL